MADDWGMSTRPIPAPGSPRDLSRRLVEEREFLAAIHCLEPMLAEASSDVRAWIAADLADLKGRVVALETSVAGALTSIANLVTSDTGLDSRLDAAEASISSLNANARLGYVSATSGTYVSVVIDLPTVSRWTKATVKVNGNDVKTAFLNSVGDGNVILSKAQSSGVHSGDALQVWVNSTLVAQGTVG